VTDRERDKPDRRRGTRRRRSSQGPSTGALTPDRFVVGGKRAVTESIRAGLALRVLIAGGTRETEGLRSVIEAARRAGLDPEPVTPADIERFGILDHQGVVAIVSPPPELDDRALASARFESDAIIVVLDGVLDPQNFGASARSAEAAGVAMLVTRKHRAAPLSGGAVRASAGALLHVPVARVTNISRALDQLKGKGFFVVGLDQAAEKGIHDAQVPPRPTAVVVGGEETGMTRLVREACDQIVAIPMAGRTASLNASAALAVGLFGYVLRPQ
jgi:23S rRNA (guanosine2251-2'-O)-methyltransferase